MLGCLAHIVVGEVYFLDDARQVGEAAAVVRAKDALVGDAQALEHVHHVVPTLKRQQRVGVHEVLRLLGRFLAVAVIRGVEVPDAVGLAKCFYQEGVVGPAGAGDFLEADVVRVQERLAVDGRPDGRVVAQQMRRIGDGERLLGWVDAVLVAAAMRQ